MDDDQTESNYRNIGEMYGKTLNWDEQLTVVRTMFPFVSTKVALQEKHFAKGYAYSCRIYAIERQDEWASMTQYLEQALEEYQRSYEETGTPEAIANLLWALCLGYVFFADEEVIGATGYEYTKSCYETGMLLIEILRETKTYEELAEYYYTLLHVIGLDGNEAGVDFCKAV
ncbi:MAG: hypothetical protein E7268_10945 [Lachnospiraceae bacterium]|nr:hypothetical protein [Lachnospiraceae bacterium]